MVAAILALALALGGRAEVSLRKRGGEARRGGRLGFHWTRKTRPPRCRPALSPAAQPALLTLSAFFIARVGSGMEGDRLCAGFWRGPRKQ